MQRLFYGLLDLLFLRAWYVKREINSLFKSTSHNQPLRVLDAGTGFGQYTYFITKRYPNVHVLAVDIKQNYLDNARYFFDKTPQARQVEFAYEDLTDLRIDGPFDFILSVDVLEHIEDDRAVFHHFARVLRPGGYVLINTPSDLGGSDVCGEEDTSFIEEHVRDGYSLDELEDKLMEAGFSPVRSLYTYGTFGSSAWRLLVKWPMKFVGWHKASVVLLPLYYLVILPIGLFLNVLDMRNKNEAGTGLVVMARKVDDTLSADDHVEPIA